MNKSSVKSSMPQGKDTSRVVEQAKEAVSHVAGDVADKAMGTVNTQFDARSEKAVETMGNVASALRETGAKLKGVGPLQDVAGKAADGVEKVAEFFEGKQVGEVLRDVERFARREPALFFGAAFAVGLVGGRFLKSSAHRPLDDEESATGGMRDEDHPIQVRVGEAARGAMNRTPALPKRPSPTPASAASTSSTTPTTPTTDTAPMPAFTGSSTPRNGIGGGGSV